MTEYGYMEGSYLRSRVLEPYSEILVNEQGEQYTRVVSIAEQARALSKEWKPVDPIDEAQMAAGDDYHIVVPRPYDAGDHIAYRYETVYDRQRIQAEIQAYKDNLAATDYKVAKCYEASLTGGEMPYNISEVVSKRQEMRDKINELEALL